MFYSGNFYFDKKYSEEYGIYQVTEEDSVLNEYGISHNNTDDNEITLSFCYANSFEEAQIWEEEVLETVLEWLITDEYKEFISEDNKNIVYFLKGQGYVKRFTPDMRGIIDVTLKTLSQYGYKYYTKKVVNPTTEFKVLNSSNINKPYKPVIELKNISSENIQISNLTTNKSPFIINNLSNKDIIIDNTIGTITDIDGNNLIMNSNRKWIELVKGYNSILVEGNCDIIFKAYYPVMV